MLFITSPSKTQASTVAPLSIEPSQIRCKEKTATLIRTLKTFDHHTLSHLMKLSDKLAAKTGRLIEQFEIPVSTGEWPSGKTGGPAIGIFQGDAWAAVQPTTYTRQQLQWAQRHLRILSGLYGILRPLDRIQPYRLEMGCKLATAEAANLYEFWQQTVSNLINRDLEATGSGLVVNLASAEYSRVLPKKHFGPKPLTLTFREKTQKGLRTVPIHAKRARGCFLHWAITSRPSKIEQLQDFTGNGYRYSADLSSKSDWVYIR